MKPNWFFDSEKSARKPRSILFRRTGAFYSEDSATGKQSSLCAKDESQALNARLRTHERMPTLLAAAAQAGAVVNPEACRQQSQCQC